MEKIYMRLWNFLFIWVKREIWGEEPQCAYASKSFQTRQQFIPLLGLEIERLESGSIL